VAINFPALLLFPAIGVKSAEPWRRNYTAMACKLARVLLHTPSHVHRTCSSVAADTLQCWPLVFSDTAAIRPALHSPSLAPLHWLLAWWLMLAQLARTLLIALADFRKNLFHLDTALAWFSAPVSHLLSHWPPFCRRLVADRQSPGR
jgi:hypothetical protein